MLAIRNAIEPRPMTVEGYRAERTVAIDQFILLATVDGDDVGAGEVGWTRSSAESGIAVGNTWVLPGSRRRGVGGQLFDRLMAHARDAGMTSVRSTIRDGDGDSLAFANRRGLEVAGRGQEGALDLSAIDPPRTVLESGVEIATLADRPDLEHALYVLNTTVWPEIPALADEPVPSFEAWRADTIEDVSFLPGLTLLAIQNERLAGAVEIYDNAGGVIFIGMTGVDPGFRRHGIARLLKSDLAWRAKAAGVIRIETYNDGTNDRIRALNESLGYVYLPWKLKLRGPVPAPAGAGD